MKYSDDRLILAAHVRTLALDFWRGERNSLSEAWHAAHPGQQREMGEFAEELNEKTPFNTFIVKAYNELENIAKIIEKSSSPEGNS